MKGGKVQRDHTYLERYTEVHWPIGISAGRSPIRQIAHQGAL